VAPRLHGPKRSAQRARKGAPRYSSKEGHGGVGKDARMRQKPGPQADTEADALFQRDLDELAKFFRTLRESEHPNELPKNLARDLRRIYSATDRALKALELLDLRHAPGQDLEQKPFNWPTVQALGMGFFVSSVKGRGGADGSEPPENYPSGVIEALERLRDAADCALELEGPKQGNHTRRASRQKWLNMIGKNFVSRYRNRFGVLPPVSSTGPAVDSLQRLLDDVGFLSPVDSATLLRRAVEGARRDFCVGEGGDSQDAGLVQGAK
jgi:hypothetical protein